MARRIFNIYGPGGFFKGYSATFYGSFIYGWVYFSIYKQMKKYDFGDVGKSPLLFLSSSFVAQLIANFLYYPYELAKVRMLVSNYYYRYLGVTHAFRCMSSSSYRGLYYGGSYFFVSYIS